MRLGNNRVRTFALLILALNFGYFAWSQARGVENSSASVQGAQRFVQADTRLVMLTEISASRLPLQEQDNVAEQTAEALTLSEASTGGQESPLSNPIEATASQARCEVISGFSDQTEAAAFISELSALEIVGSLDIQQEQISSTWWVHLPPFQSQPEAQGVINELVSKGIDNFYMRTGELAGGISLGVFSRQQSAQVAQAELLERGYQAAIREIPRYVSNAYVTVETSDATLVDSQELRAFLATKTKLEVTEKLCETIAR